LRAKKWGEVKPTWVSEDRRVSLFRGDCREILPYLSNIDTIVTDPVWPNAISELPGSDDPYGLFANMWEALPHIPARAAIQLGCDSDPRFLDPVPLPFFRYVFLELSRKGYKGRLLNSGDVGFLFGAPPKSRPGLRVIPGRCNDADSKGKQTDHPCPRKLRHVEFLVWNWSEPTDVICDPFMGSGTAGVACIRTDRRFIGIELPKYFEMARKRIEGELRKIRLDFGE